MKNLIITVGIIVFVVSITGMQFTCSKMLHTKQEIKFAADEAAATAALYLNEKAFREGNIAFDEGRAENEARKITGLNMPQGRYDLIIDYFQGERPAVKVVIKKGKLRAVSKYEYVPYLKEKYELRRI